MPKLRLFSVFRKEQPESTPKDEKLTATKPQEASTHIAPIDYTKELFTNESKDRRLFEFYNFYRKRDFFDRYKGVAIFMLLLGYALSLASCYLSYPFLDLFLSDDVPSHIFRLGVVIVLLLLNEVVKHLSLAQVFKTFFTYHQKPIVSTTILFLTVGFSIYACVNGIKTASEQAYNPPKPSDFVTQYDNQIANLKTVNEQIFERSNWKGKLNSSSKEGKAYAQNETLITELTAKAVIEREQLYSAALLKYNSKHEHQSNFRKYAGYVIESMIIFCAGFYLLYMFKASFEHIARIVQKFPTFAPMTFSQNATHDPVLAANAIGFKTYQNLPQKEAQPPTDKGNNSNSNTTITNYSNEDLKKLIKSNKLSLNAYKWKLKNGKGSEQNNRQKIAYFENEIERLKELQQQFINS